VREGGSQSGGLGAKSPDADRYYDFTISKYPKIRNLACEVLHIHSTIYLVDIKALRIHIYTHLQLLYVDCYINNDIKSNYCSVIINIHTKR